MNLNKYAMSTFVNFLLQDPSAMPRPTSQDLAGFWDLLQLSIDDVSPVKKVRADWLKDF